jgi:hypothetical protein
MGILKLDKGFSSQTKPKFKNWSPLPSVGEEQEEQLNTQLWRPEQR